MTDWKVQRFALIEGMKMQKFVMTKKRRDELLVEMCLKEFEESQEKT